MNEKDQLDHRDELKEYLDNLLNSSSLSEFLSFHLPPSIKERKKSVDNEFYWNKIKSEAMVKEKEVAVVNENKVLNKVLSFPSDEFNSEENVLKLYHICNELFSERRRHSFGGLMLLINSQLDEKQFSFPLKNGIEIGHNLLKHTPSEVILQQSFILNFNKWITSYGLYNNNILPTVTDRMVDILVLAIDKDENLAFTENDSLLFNSLDKALMMLIELDIKGGLKSETYDKIKIIEKSLIKYYEQINANSFQVFNSYKNKNKDLTQSDVERFQMRCSRIKAMGLEFISSTNNDMENNSRSSVRYIPKI